MNTYILLIEAEIRLCRSLELDLLNSSITSMSNAHAVIKRLTLVRELQPGLVLLRTQLPEFPRLKICCRLRSTSIQTPLIFMSKNYEVYDCVARLDARVDDDVVYLLALEELQAKIRSRLRRVALETQPNRLQFSDLTLDQATREVYRHQQAIKLTAKEFTLLEYFMTHPQQIMTPNQIINHAWNDNLELDFNALEVHIRYLRLKLERHHKQRLIHTIRGVGYVLRESLLKQASFIKPVRSTTHSHRLVG